jgi:peroxiredoxin Q/BCP
VNFKHRVVFLACLIFSNFIQARKPKLVGKPAPIFTAQAVFPDGTIQSFDLRDYIGKADIVLYFYPFDGTPTCSKQAESFRNGFNRLKENGIMIIGVSCDAPASHKRFIEKLNLPFPLVSDTRIKRDISSKYGTVGFFHSKRRTFLINKKGIIVKVFNDVFVDTQIDDILKSFL